MFSGYSMKHGFTNQSINMKDLMEDFMKDLNNGSDDGMHEILWYYSMND